MLSVFLFIQYFFNKPQNDPLAQVSYQKVQIFQTIAKKSSLQLSDGSHQHLQCFKKNVFCVKSMAYVAFFEKYFNPYDYFD